MVVFVGDTEDYSILSRCFGCYSFKIKMAIYTGKLFFMCAFEIKKQSMVFFSFLVLLAIVFSSAADYDIVIVGCGPAGIGAAIELQKAKVNFILLEARNRIGGRAFTDKHTFDHVSVDVGAEWIHKYGPNNALYYLHKTLNANDNDRSVSLFEVTKTGCQDADGSTVSCAEANDFVDDLLSPTSQNQEYKEDLSVRQVIQDKYNKLSEGRLKRLVDAILVGVEEYEAADLDQLSAEQYFSPSFSSNESTSNVNLALSHGYGTFLERIVESKKLPVQLNSVVKVVRIDNNRVHLTTLSNKSFSAKRVLITIPLGCLKARSIVFDPPLPEWKINAIDAMGFGNTNKILVQFPFVFWDPSWTIAYLANQPFPFAVCYPEKRMLSFMIGGGRALAMERMSDTQIIAQVMQSLEKTFSPKNVPRPQQYLISRWNQDQFSRGSYSYFSLTSNRDTLKALARETCNNTVYWAGEHTSSGGSVHTAFGSGQREAKKLIAALNAESHQSY
jgi:monoamine oxidase